MSGFEAIIRWTVTIAWWAGPAVNFIALLMRIGAIEPTVESADRIAGWFIRSGAVKVRFLD